MISLARTVYLYLSVLMFAAAPGLYAADSMLTLPTLNQQIDALFQQYTHGNSPGCAVAVIHQGRYIHKAGYGLANMEYNIPITGQSVFRIGSTSKQFTAMAVALLAEQGSLDLDADVHQYLPDLMPYKHKVTVRQMIHHIAGMGDYDHAVFKKMDGSEFRFGDEDYWTIGEFYQRVRQADLIYEPGTKWEYSNLAYFLLSQVVEKVSGQSLSQFAAENIFRPLGMKHSLFNDNVRQIIPYRADGYQKLKDGRYEIYMTNLDWVGDGGVYTSLDDFILWDQNFYHNIIGDQGQAFIDSLTKPGENAVYETKKGEKQLYSFGYFHGELAGRKAIFHSGGWVGFVSFYSRLPDLGLSTVMFCNAEHIDAQALSEQLLKVSLENLKL